jgi:hypothetical protein
VDAAEAVIAEGHGMKADGYFRAMAESALEAARDAALAEFVRETDSMFERRMGHAKDAEEGDAFDRLDAGTGQGRR